jgi:uncharacterized membrane protein
MTEVRVITFDGRKTAAKALDTIEDEGGYLWLDDVAVVSRSKRGVIRVHSTWAQDDTGVALSAGGGALTGALIGAMMGPQGAIAGAATAGALAGGSLGGMLGGLFEVSVADDRLERFALRLKDDTSALVLVADEPYANEFASVFDRFNGELIVTNLNEHDVNAIHEALRASRARAD